MFQNALRNNLVQGDKWYKRHHSGCNKEEPGSDKPCKTGKSLHCSESQFSYLLNIEITTEWFVWLEKFNRKTYWDG